MTFCTEQKVLVFFIFIGFIFNLGCSSSSNTVRYGSNNDEDEKETRIRYPQNEKIDTLETEIPTENEIIDPDESPDNLTSIDISVLYRKNITQAPPMFL